MGGGRGFGGGGPSGRRQGNEFQFGGDYIVFLPGKGEPTPRYVRTGLTDLDYSEVVSGLSESDSVLVLPSASLVQSQQDAKDRFAADDRRWCGARDVAGQWEHRDGAASDHRRRAAMRRIAP